MELKCQSCGEAVQAPEGWDGGLLVCPHCSGQVVAEAGVVPADDTRPCPSCGEKIQKDALKCRHCGEFLDPALRAKKTEGVKALAAYQKGMKSLGYLLILIAVLAIIGGAVLLGNGQPAAAILGATVVVSGVIVLILSILCLLRFGWANYIVLVLFVVNLAGNLMTLLSGRPPNFIAILLIVCVLAYAGGNLKKLGKVKAAGLDPRGKA